MGPSINSCHAKYVTLGACRRIRSGFERLFFLNRFNCCCRSNCRIKAAAVVRLTASGCIDDETDIAYFAVFARRKNASSRADDAVFRQSQMLFWAALADVAWQAYADRERMVGTGGQCRGPDEGPRE